MYIIAQVVQNATSFFQNTQNKSAPKMHFSVDLLSKICYNITTLPMGEGSTMPQPGNPHKI